MSATITRGAAGGAGAAGPFMDNETGHLPTLGSKLDTVSRAVESIFNPSTEAPFAPEEGTLFHLRMLNLTQNQLTVLPEIVFDWPRLPAKPSVLVKFDAEPCPALKDLDAS